jgi:hypothetical protein
MKACNLPLEWGGRSIRLYSRSLRYVHKCKVIIPETCMYGLDCNHMQKHFPLARRLTDLTIDQAV